MTPETLLATCKEYQRQFGRPLVAMVFTQDEFDELPPETRCLAEIMGVAVEVWHPEAW